MKKLIAIPFVLIMILFMLSPVFGGGQSASQAPARPGVYQRDPNLNPPGTFPLNKSVVPLTIGLSPNANVEDFNTNWMTQQIQKNGNYKLTFEMYPAGELNQKIELMIIAGGQDLPDIVFGNPGMGTLTKYGQTGMIIPLNEYFEKSAYWYHQKKDEFDFDLLKYITSYDGNIYGMFVIQEQTNGQYSSAWMMIYEPWLVKLGLKMPETTADFANVLRAFRDRDPNGNGLRDEIPLTGNRDTMLANFMRSMMNPFIYSQANFWILNNGRIDVSFNKPEYREGLRYAQSLVNEGLVSRLAFTQDQVALRAELSTNPANVGVFAQISSSLLGANDFKRAEYIILPPLQGPTGIRQSTWAPQLPSIGMYITKNCKTPEAAFVMGDYMFSDEMSIATRFGEKGVDWLVPPPGTKACYEDIGFPATLEPVLVWGTMQNKYWAQSGPQMLPAKWANGQAYTPNNGIVPSATDHVYAQGRSMAPAIKYANRNPIVGLIYNEQEQAVMDEFQATILSYVNEHYARFVTGDLNIERDWDRYVSEFNRMGLTEIIRATQSAWDRMNK